MRLVRRIDQLNTYAHLFRHSLHRSFQNMCHAELLTDLRYVFRRTLVTLRRCARDHLEVGNLGEPRQYFFLNSFGKISVVRIATQVFKWQNSDRFLW